MGAFSRRNVYFVQAGLVIVETLCLSSETKYPVMPSLSAEGSHVSSACAREKHQREKPATADHVSSPRCLNVG